MMRQDKLYHAFQSLLQAQRTEEVGWVASLSWSDQYPQYFTKWIDNHKRELANKVEFTEEMKMIQRQKCVEL